MAPKKTTKAKTAAKAKKSNKVAEKVPSPPIKSPSANVVSLTPPFTSSASSSKVTKSRAKVSSKSKTNQDDHKDPISSSSREAELTSLLQAYAQDPNGEQGSDPSIPGWLPPHPPNSRPLPPSQQSHHVHTQRSFRSLEHAAQFLTSPGLPRRRSARIIPSRSFSPSWSSLAAKGIRPSAIYGPTRRLKLQRQSSSDDLSSSKLQQIIAQRIEAYLGSNGFSPPRNVPRGSSRRSSDRMMPVIATDMKRGTSRTVPVSTNLTNDQNQSVFQVDVWPGPGYGPPGDDGIVDPQNPTGSLSSRYARSTAGNENDSGEWNDEHMSRILQHNDDEMIPVNNPSTSTNEANPSRKAFLPKERYIIPVTHSAAFNKSVFSPDHPINNPKPATTTKPAWSPPSSSRRSSKKSPTHSSPSKSVSFDHPLVSSRHHYPSTTTSSSSTDIRSQTTLPALKPFASRVPARHTNHLLFQDLYARYIAAFHNLYGGAMMREKSLIASYQALTQSQDELVDARHHDVKVRLRSGELDQGAALDELEIFVRAVGAKEEAFRRKVERKIQRLVENTRAAGRVVDGEVKGEDYLVAEMEDEMGKEREREKGKGNEMVKGKGEGTRKIADVEK